jgi:hypothetical protein
LIFSEDEFVVKEEESGDSDTTEMSEADLEVLYIHVVDLKPLFTVGSVCFLASRIRIHSQRYGSGSESLYHQAKIVRKTFPLLWLLFDFLSLKNDVNAVMHLQKVISRQTFLF